MKTYWDHEEKDRAELSADDVRRLLDFELMDKGVLKVEVPRLEPLADVTLPKVPMYGIKHESGRYGGGEQLGVMFATLEAAEAFVKLAPLVRCHEYEADANFAKPILTAAIVPEGMAGEQDVMNSITVLRANKAAKERNDKAAREYEAAIREVEKAGQGVWEDWYSCCAQKARNQKVMDTLAEYRKLTDSNEAMALTFLAKAFKPHEIEKAAAWFDVSLVPPPMAMPAPNAQPKPEAVPEQPF